MDAHCRAPSYKSSLPCWRWLSASGPCSAPAPKRWRGARCCCWRVPRCICGAAGAASSSSRSPHYEKKPGTKPGFSVQPQHRSIAIIAIVGRSVVGGRISIAVIRAGAVSAVVPAVSIRAVSVVVIPAVSIRAVSVAAVITRRWRVIGGLRVIRARVIVRMIQRVDQHPADDRAGHQSADGIAAVAIMPAMATVIVVPGVTAVVVIAGESARRGKHAGGQQAAQQHQLVAETRALDL